MRRFCVALLTAAVATVASAAVLSAQTARSAAEYSFSVANAPKDTSRATVACACA
jgi:hypothetical protein